MRFLFNFVVCNPPFLIIHYHRAASGAPARTICQETNNVVWYLSEMDAPPRINNATESALPHSLSIIVLVVEQEASTKNKLIQK